MHQLASLSKLTSVLFAGAIFGFFYAWICSTMWGLDDGDPRVAIAAMQNMNASVRNAVFAPAFFGTPVVLMLTGLVVWWKEGRSIALWFVAAAIVYFLFAFLPTAMVNVPMNRELGATAIPDDLEQAHAIWTAYSQKWQFWNILRTIASGASLALAATGLMMPTKWCQPVAA